MGTGALTFGNGSQFTYEMNTNLALAVAADLVNAAGALLIDPSAMLNISDAGSTQVPLGTKITLISYSGSWIQPPGSCAAEPLCRSSQWHLVHAWRESMEHSLQ